MTITNATGADKLIISGNSQSRVFYVNTGADLTLSGVTITGGSGAGIGSDITTWRGGGIFNNGNLTISNAIVSGNGNTSSASSFGGGIFNSGVASLQIINSTVANNTALVTGGIYNNGTLSITNSTLSGNSASINNGGALLNTGNLKITNSTLSGNFARGTGGGITNGGTATLTNVTITNNTSSINPSNFGGGGIQNNAQGTLNLLNTIVAENIGANFQPDSYDVFKLGAITSSYSLIGRGASGVINGENGNQVGTPANPLDPKLGAHANNGGATQTHALLAGSPAINAGNNANAPATDQRGFARIVGGTIDIGAYEEQSVPACTYFNPGSLVVRGSGGDYSFDVVTQDGCSWTAVSNTSWITVTSGASGTGSGKVNFSVAPILPGTTAERYGSITINSQTFTITQPRNCSFTVSPTIVNVPAAPPPGSTTITGTLAIQSGNVTCFAGASSNVPWITINAVGSDTVYYQVAPNNGAARSGTIIVSMIGGNMLETPQTVTVNQAAGCTYSLTPTSASIVGSGGNGSFSVLASNPTCTWNAASNVTWITISGDASGSGNGIVNFSVEVNNGAARIGTITAASQTFTVNQGAGCSFSLSPMGMNIAPIGGSGSFNVTSNAGCSDPFTAFTTTPWITVTGGASGNGSGTVSFSCYFHCTTVISEREQTSLNKKFL